jgi:uncharacterized membrane protein YfcA
MLQTDAYFILAPITALAGLIRGFAGFGGPLVLLPVLGLYLSPTASVAATMWVDLCANVQLLPQVRQQAQSSVVVPLTAGTLVAMPLGVLLLLTVDPVLMKRGISAGILVAALVLLSGWRYRGAISPIGWAIVGALTGVVMGATSIAVTAALFLNAGSQTARESRANFIVWVFFATLALLAMLAGGEGIAATPLRTIGVLAPVYVVGAILGTRLNKGAPQAVVRRAVLALVAMIATATLLI